MMREPLPASAKVAATVPAAAAAIVAETLKKRLDELAADLRVPTPALAVIEADVPALTIDDFPARVPQRLARQPRVELAADLAERLAAAAWRGRWNLLLPALRARRVSPLALEQAAALGLDLDDLTAIGRLRGRTPEDDMWRAAEQRPAALAVLVAPDLALPGPEDRALLSAFATQLTGLVLPTPSFATDRDLPTGRIRLRIRAVRTELSDPITARALPAAAAKLFARHAAMLLDPITMTRTLLRAASGTMAALPTVLRAAPADRLAAALRPLLAAGFGLPDPPALVAAILGEGVPIADRTARRVVLPGGFAVDQEAADLTDVAADRLAARLRAAIVPGALLRRAGGIDRTVSFWRLEATALDALPVRERPETARDVLVPAALPAARAEALLLVPNGHGPAVRALLQDDLPDLVVVEQGELPARLPLRWRADVTFPPVPEEKRA